jgi:anaerobic magnesium-protoporphyrin IX monomethyl ester cyclase
MRMAAVKVQLFVPPQGYVAQRWAEGTSMPPLGILFLAAVLEREGIEVEVVPADVLGCSWREVAARIEAFKPDMVGVTTTSENRFDSFRLAKVAKRVDPAVLTVLGGPHISMAREDTLKHIREVDVLVVGEGERTVVELAKAHGAGQPLADVRGLYFRDGEGNIVSTGPREQLENLDDLPFPARHLIPMDKYNFFVETRDGKRRKAQNLMTSRGCPFHCYFCATPLNWGRKVRGHSPERVLGEIEHLIDRYGAAFIWFYDDTLNYDPRRLHRIMDMIIQRRLDIKFANEFRIDMVDRPLLEKMRRAGLERGYFGVEAGSARVRRDIVRKDFDIDRAYRFVRWSRELDFVPGPFFIYSHHTETWPEAKQTLDIMGEIKSINPQADISTSILHVYPGTPIEAIARQQRIIPEDFSWSRRRDMKRVPVLPAAQGQVPLFKDRLSWRQIAELLVGFPSSSGKRVLSPGKIKKILKSLTGFKQIGIHLVFLWVFIRNKFRGKKT